MHYPSFERLSIETDVPDVPGQRSTITTVTRTAAKSLGSKIPVFPLVKAANGKKTKEKGRKKVESGYESEVEVSGLNDLVSDAETKALENETSASG